MDAARLDDLTKGVLAPLILGGPMRLVKPFGPALALSIGVGRSVPDDEVRSRMDVVRIRIVRQVAPLDFLPPISAAEFALAAALNDLLQSANHLLSGPLTRGRHQKLLSATQTLLEAIPPPQNTLEVLSRHAAFSRAQKTFRSDVIVRNRVTSSSFRGELPPKRLFLWKDLRRVTEDRTTVTLANMADGLKALSAQHYAEALRAWLALSPLSDLATLTRATPPFAWSTPTLALVSYPIGRTLALRALARESLQNVVHSLRRAADSLVHGSRARAIAESFASAVLERDGAR